MLTLFHLSINIDMQSYDSGTMMSFRGTAWWHNAQKLKVLLQGRE